MDEGDRDDDDDGRDREVDENALVRDIVGAGLTSRKNDGIHDEGAEQDRSEVVKGGPADDDDAGDDCREAGDASQRDMTADGATSVGPAGYKADFTGDVIQDVRAGDLRRRVVSVVVAEGGDAFGVAFDQRCDVVGPSCACLDSKDDSCSDVCIKSFLLALANPVLRDATTKA